MGTELVSISDIEKMASAVAASRLFGVKTKEEAMAIMLLAQAEGMHPAAAARDYHIIQGKPAMKADAMMARYINSGGKVTWHEYTPEKVSATFEHPAGGTVKIEWTFDMARKIGLTSKDNWKNYPRQMLRARVISEGVRTTNPAVAVGIYTPEEVSDFDDKGKRAPRERDMGAAEVVDEKITDGMHKRLEALIVEYGVDREQVKEWCLKQFGKLHLPDLSKQEYNAVDLYLLDFKPTTAEGGPHTEGNAGGAATQAHQPPAPAPSSGPAYVTADQAVALEDACKECGVSAEAFKKKAGIERFAQVLAEDFNSGMAWIIKRKTT